MSSTASNCGIWRQFIAAFTNQFPNEDEVDPEVLRGIEIFFTFDPPGSDKRMDEALWGRPIHQRWCQSPRVGISDGHTDYERLLHYCMSCIPGHRDLPRDRALYLIQNQAELRRIIREDILLLSVLDKFVFVKTFDIVVPADYQHGTQLQSFREKYGKSLRYFEKGLTDDSFRKVSAQLNSGQRVTVSIYRQVPPGHTTSDERMVFLRSLPGNMFYGVQGASLVYELKGDQLEKGYAYVAMDEEGNLLLVGGRHGVPRMTIDREGGLHLNITPFKGMWNDDELLISFRDVDIEQQTA